MDYNEFSQRIKTKYPEYQNMDNKELAQKIIAKYPEYESQVTFDIEQPQKQQTKGVDLTPSGLFKGSQDVIASAITAPITANKKGVSLGEAYKQNKEILKQHRQNNPTPGQDLIVDLAGYSLIPAPNAKVAGVAKLGQFATRAALQGGLPMAAESLKRGGNALGGLAGGSLIGAGIQALPYVGKGISKFVNNPNTQKNIAKTLEFLTSAPEEYSQRAIQKELAGKSILKGKFNKRDLNENYREAGKKAIEGYQKAKLKTNQELNDATLNLNNLEEINRNQLANNIIDELDKYAYGGEANAALEQKGNDIYNYLDEITNRKSNSGLHVTKRNIQNMIRNKYGQETGEGINALKDIARNINDKLYQISPEYEAANVAEQQLHNINDLLGGMNKKTIGSKLRNAETDATIRSGYNQALEELNNLVEPQYKFLDEVNDLRARESLENIFPGQGGGYGSAQGVGNKVRGGLTTLLAGLGGAGGGIPGAVVTPLLGSLAFSPKIMAQGTIKNLGKLNNLGEKLQNLPPLAQRLLTPLAVKGTAPLLYGGVEYNDIR